MFLSRFSGVPGSWEGREEKRRGKKKKEKKRGGRGTIRKETDGTKAAESGSEGVEVFRSGANRSHNIYHAHTLGERVAKEKPEEKGEV